MIIKNISVENFQSYYSKQTIEFSDGLNLVIGNGGKGKSKLFNAFYWVLFGKIYITGLGWCKTDGLPSSAKGDMKRHEFINMKALFEAAEGDSITTTVSLELEDDKGVLYQIERSVTAMRLQNDNWRDAFAWEVNNSVLKVIFDSPTGTRIITDLSAESRINELFPDGIRNYIWFQGEALESLINFRNKETLKAAVKHISYFPFYEKLSDIINYSVDKIRTKETAQLREKNKQNSEIKYVLNKIDNLQKQIEREEKEQKRLEALVEEIQIALNDGEAKIGGLAKYSTLVAKYKECDVDITRYLAETTRIDNYQREKVPSLWILRGIEPMIKEAKQIIERHKEQEFTMPEKKYLDNPSRDKLEEILKDGKCFVCGSRVEEHDETYKYILERIRLQEEFLNEMEEYHSNMQLFKRFNMFIGGIQGYPDSLLISLRNIDKQCRESDDEMQKYLDLRKRKQKESQEYDKQIEDIKRQYGVDPIRQAEELGEINSRVNYSRSSLKREENRLASTKQLLAQLRAELKAAEKEFTKLGRGNDDTKVPETEWKNISIFLSTICKRVQENARKELLRKIENRANEFYSKFTEHDNGYKGNVRIGDDYSIEFDPGLNTSHEDRKKMSIINALLSLNQEAMATYYPFISDAPTSSFDAVTTFKYLLGIKDIFGQSIIMTKDVDLDSDKYEELKSQSKITRIFLLESDLHCGHKEPDLHEVSTSVKRLK